MFAAPRDAASVILLREGPEVFLLRRRRSSSFMGGAFVFPGGAADPGERDPRVTAARELFEEAGVLLAKRPVADVAALRKRVLAGEPLPADLELDVGALTYFAHWITPSVEPKRFSARFFVAVLPTGQAPSFDAQETVDEVWVTPAEGLRRAGELQLPPPQVHTLQDLARAGSVADVLALARERDRRPHPIMPRMAPTPGGGFALLLPWDPEYGVTGTGDSAPMPADHPMCTGPSRFILEDRTWKNIAAPGSTTAG